MFRPLGTFLRQQDGFGFACRIGSTALWRSGDSPLFKRQLPYFVPQRFLEAPPPRPASPLRHAHTLGFVARTIRTRACESFVPVQGVIRSLQRVSLAILAVPKQISS